MKRISGIQFPTILDRYIIRRFFGGFVFSITLIVSIAVTIDFGEHIKHYVQHHLHIGMILREYYIYFIPYIITFIGPYFVFITVIYFTSRLANQSEIIAMFNSGMSFGRFLVPYISTSCLLAVFLWYIINYIVPYTDRKRLEFENKYIASAPQSSDMHIHRKIDDSTYFYFRIYDNMQHAAYNVSIEKFKNDRLISKTLAERADYDTATMTWTLIHYFTRTIDGANFEEKIMRGEKMKSGFKMDPTILVKRWTHIQELTRSELKDKARDLIEQGSEGYIPYEVEYHKRTSKCFGLIILTIIGVILSAKKVRGGLGMHLMVGLTIGSIYEVFVKFADAVALKTSFDPFIAVWIPNLVYLVVAFYLWKRIQE